MTCSANDRLWLAHYWRMHRRVLLLFSTSIDFYLKNNVIPTSQSLFIEWPLKSQFCPKFWKKLQQRIEALQSIQDSSVIGRCFIIHPTAPSPNFQRCFLPTPSPLLTLGVNNARSASFLPTPKPMPTRCWHCCCRHRTLSPTDADEIVKSQATDSALSPPELVRGRSALSAFSSAAAQTSASTLPPPHWSLWNYKGER